MLYQFRNENALRFGRKEGKRKEKSYTNKDVDNFIKDVKNGMPASDAAKLHGIPQGTAHGLKPDELKKKRNKPLAIDLLKKKESGVIDISYAAICRLSNYEKTAVKAFKVKIQEGVL